jgi:hypothetical protein
MLLWSKESCETLRGGDTACREQVRQAYNVAVFEVKEEIPAEKIRRR